MHGQQNIKKLNFLFRLYISYTN